MKKKSTGILGLFHSTNFWNAIIGSASAIVAGEMTANEIIVYGVLTLFGLRSISKGAQDYMEARSLGGTNPPPDKDDK